VKFTPHGFRSFERTCPCASDEIVKFLKIVYCRSLGQLTICIINGIIKLLALLTGRLEKRKSVAIFGTRCVVINVGRDSGGGTVNMYAVITEHAE
jgi:hypothetical protein